MISKTKKHGKLRLGLAVLVVATVGLIGRTSPYHRFLHALELEQKNKTTAALAEYQKLLGSIPPGEKHARAATYFRIGECFWKLERGDDAFEAFHKAADIDPASVLAQLRLAQLYLVGGSMNHALEHASVVLAQAPANADAWSIVGAANASMNQIPEASRAYAQVLDTDPGRVAAAVALADIYDRQNRVQDARRVLRKAADAQPSSATPLLALARLEEAQRNNGAAEHDYRAALARENTQQTHLQLAEFLERNARASEAEEVLRHQDAGQPQPSTFLADFQLISGRAFLASARYLAALRGEPPRSDHAAPRPGEEAAIAAKIIEADLETPSTAGNDSLPARQAAAVQRATTHLHLFQGKLDPITREILQGEIALAAGDLSGAREHTSKALAQDPQSAVARYLLGRTSYGAGNSAEARNDWQAALASDENFIPARIALTQQALEARDFQAAEQEILPVVRDEPGNLRGLLLYARALAGQQRYDDALSIARRALAITEANPDPHLVLGEVALKQRRFGTAMKHFQRALVMDLYSGPAIEGLVQTYRHGHVDRAVLEHMERMGARDPASPAILELVGRLYADHGWYGDAIRVLKQALALDPQRATAAGALARLYVKQGRVGDAEVALVLANDRRARLLIAARAQQQGNNAAAIRDYEQLVREGETSGVAANNLAWLYAARGENLDRALTLAQVARDRAPRNAAFLDTLGVVHLKRREYSQAAEVMKRASALASDADPAQRNAIRQHLAEALRLSGEPMAP